MKFLCSVNYFSPFELVTIMKRLGHIKRDGKNNKMLIRTKVSKMSPVWVEKILGDELKFKRLTEANKILVNNEYFEPQFYGEKVNYQDSLISLNSVETNNCKVCIANTFLFKNNQ